MQDGSAERVGFILSVVEFMRGRQVPGPVFFEGWH